MVRRWKPLWVVLLLFWPMPGEGIEFTDVDPDNWYAEAVSALSEDGVIGGIGGTSQFAPHAPTKRAEFLKMCLLALRDDDRRYPPPEQPPYPDVPAEEWFAGHVEVAKILEIIDPLATNFEPGRNITRREAADMVSRALRLQGGLRAIEANCTFSDVNPSDTGLLEVCRAGLMRGYGDGRFQPERNISRAEAAVLLFKARKLAPSDLAFVEMNAFVSTSHYLPELTVPTKRAEIGIRLNNPSNPNNLIQVKARAYRSVDGIDFVLRRSNGNLRVWADDTMETPLLGDGANEVEIPSDVYSIRDLHVENVSKGAGDLFLEARRSGSGSLVGFTRLRFRTFKNFIVIVGGEGQEPSKYSPSNPALCSDDGCGVFDLGRILYGRGYDVEIYDDDWIGPSGGGAGYDDVVAAVEQRQVQGLVLVGYSHGGGSVFDLAEKLRYSRVDIDGTFILKVTAYIDAITNETAGAENRYPPDSVYHVNLYQRHCLRFCGGPVATSAIESDVADFPNGENIDHFEIDDFRLVWNEILRSVEERLRYTP